MAAGGLRPARELVAEQKTKWVYVRVIAKDSGLFLGLDACDAFEAGPGFLVVPGVCVGTTRAEVDAVIAALSLLRDRLAS